MRANIYFDGFDSILSGNIASLFQKEKCIIIN